MFRASDYPINSWLEAYRAEERKQGRDVSFEPFAYNAEFVPLGVNATLQQVNATDADSGFAVFKTMQVAFNSASNIYVPFGDVVIQIIQDASGRAMQDRPTHLINLFGRGSRPFEWIRPMLIGPKSSWTTIATNNSSTVGLNLRLSYWGVKVFYRPLQ